MKEKENIYKRKKSSISLPKLIKHCQQHSPNIYTLMKTRSNGVKTNDHNVLLLTGDKLHSKFT